MLSDFAHFKRIATVFSQNDQFKKALEMFLKREEPLF